MFLHVPQHGGSETSGIRYPGLLTSPDILRKDIRYGEACRFDLDEGDLLTIVSEDGGGSACLFAFQADGAPAFGALGLGDLTPVSGATAVLVLPELKAWIEAHGGATRDAMCVPVFDEATGAGERYIIRAEAACVLWIGLPRPAEATVEGGGGTLSIEVARARKASESLPEPLGEIRDEFRIDSGTATAYPLAEGDYVQIIDVEGRQCSDFMGLRSSALDQGLERIIDSTVTRTMVGHAYPHPGLFDRFYDQDMRPMLSVVQDTVGRHDTFALACTARGYEDRGFPGHLNCSDNISGAFEPYGIGARPAWPAINLFFNSRILPDNNLLHGGESWSRPGDFVVMRALTDLVCVSTACPDDIDPINGWNPTDVHVRIYKPQKPIRRAIAHRPFAESDPIMTGESAFHTRTSELTQDYRVARDLWLPATYESTRALDEYWACRNAVTVQDMSSLRKFDITGPDAQKLLQACLTRNISKLSVNRGTYALMLTDTGSVLDDGTLFRLGPDLFRWCCGSDESGRQLKAVAEEMNLKVWVKALWSAMPNLAVQGPKSRELLSRILFTRPQQPALESVRWFGFTVGRLKDREGAAFMLTRTGFTGELGYEIFCDRSQAVEIWDALLEAGADFGVTPMGNDALAMLRIEAGLMIAGAEFGPDIDPFEAGLGFAVDMKKDDFVGHAALLRNKTAQRRKLVGLLFEGNECPAHGDPVLKGRSQVGVITSATQSPMLERPIAMARIAVEHSEMGTVLDTGQLDGRMKRLSAAVTSIPFVDPKRERALA